jgi:L-ascorbate metabolism protein UlaG (beta-lactamase superfamily)
MESFPFQPSQDADTTPIGRARQAVHLHPWMSVGAALTAGYLLGRMTGLAVRPRRVTKLPGATHPAALAQGSIFFVGTATTVIRYGGFTILTDPNFLHAGDHAHLGYGLTSVRRTNPAIEIDDLPPLDLCVLSHMHGDHWDHIAAERLPKTLPIVTTREATATLRQQGFTAPYALYPWQHTVFAKGDVWLRITAMPGRHGPGPLNALLPAVNGHMLEWGSGSEPPRFRMYISGDTLVGEHLRAIPERFPDIDLALLHLGGTRLFGVLLTMDARQGVQAVRIVRPKAVVPIHYNDYRVFKSPVDDFLAAMAADLPDVAIQYLRHGDTYTFQVP